MCRWENSRKRIIVQDRIDVQGEFVFEKSINVQVEINMQTQIRPCRVDFFLKVINVPTIRPTSFGMMQR